MKKIIIITLCFFTLLKTTNAINASSYIVMDMDNQNVLFKGNENDPMLIASITKIMTAIVAIENNDDLNKVITVDKEILKAVGSAIYIEVGEKLKLIDLLYGLMLRSGNDAAAQIAISTSGSIKEFSNLMNVYAQKIGMKNSYFVNPSGLEENDGSANKSTAYDMALLTSYAYQNKLFRKIFGTKDYTCKSNLKTYYWVNKNKLLKYDYVTGGKTGYTKKAKRTLVTTANIKNKNIVIVTINGPNDFKDHNNMYKVLIKDYINYPILNKNKFKIMFDSIYIEDKLYIKNNFNLLIKDTKDIKIKYYLYKLKKYNNNQKVGMVEVYQNNKLIHNQNIYIKKQKDKISIFKKIFK